MDLLLAELKEGEISALLKSEMHSHRKISQITGVFIGSV